MDAAAVATLARQDQADAKERNWERRAASWALLILWIFFSLGVYCYLAARGDVPAAPWSPIGHSQHQQHRAPVQHVTESRPV